MKISRSQSLMNQNMMQTQNTMMNMPQQQQQPGTQNQYMNQQVSSSLAGTVTAVLIFNFAFRFQLHQMNQSTQQQQAPLQNVPLQQVNNNNLMPPSLGNTANTISAQNCIRSGCNNPAIVSADWEDEYCSNECVTEHCRGVFANWVHTQASAQQQQNFSAVK